ncbi:homeobox protein CHOX-CAD [Patella vulgata]|uniref:homeobox protein CHOX-CAD n=1 Tax=Patella vulgata TaxID=6465 RepID=UPI0021806387|nr:homeobox protein CHOX-CAD [Patella vulgata]
MAVCHENSSSVFSTRPSPTSFNFPHFGYGAQAPGYAPDYSQYSSMAEATYQQPPWAGMYASAPRAAHSGLEDWTQGYMVPVTSSAIQQPYNYSYRPPVATTMGIDYSQSVMGQGHSPLNGSPPLTSSGDDSPNGSGSSISKAMRAPYEWMKPAQAPPASGKTRTKDKYRVVYTDHQRLELEKEFHYSRYITIRRKAEIAAQLALSERQVKIWFQNRRAKERKQNKKGKDMDGGMPGKLEYDEPLSPSSGNMSLPNIMNTDIQQHHQQQPQQHSYHHQQHHQQSHSPQPVLSPPTSLPQLMVKSELSAIDLGNSVSPPHSY